MEIVVVKVRPSYGDKKLHVLRFLFPDNMFSFSLVESKLNELFPYGFFKPCYERFMIDYSYLFSCNELVSLCNHEYLAQYLTSSKKLE